MKFKLIYQNNMLNLKYQIKIVKVVLLLKKTTPTYWKIRLF